MKYLVPALVIASLVSIGILGLGFFDMEPNHQRGCIASVVDGTTCSENIVALATHHISILRSLTQSIIPTVSGWLLLLVFLSLGSLAVYTFYKTSLPDKFNLSFRRSHDPGSGSLFRQRKITSWLALFELSPGFS